MYTALAKFYDLFMSGGDIKKWSDYVCSLLKDKKRGVDMACGTGRFTLELLKRGYDIFGVDISRQMLNAAKQNAYNAGVKAEFVEGDMQSFRFNKSYEFVLAMCDAVNYLADPSGFFSNAYGALQSGGILIFDISSAYKLTNVLGSNTYSDTKGDITYIWNNFLSLHGDYVDMELTFFERRGQMFERSIETQRQYSHDEKKLFSLLTDAGFTDIKVYGGLTKKSPREDDERLHFAARRQ